MTSTDRFCELPSGIRICYRVDGPESGRPLLLIAGLALDLTCWPPSLVSALADRGYRVIRFDNRDAGRSTHLTTSPPSTLRQALAITRPTDYDLTDMANDTIGLLDALGITRADFVGMSMGGMIAQVAAAIAPDRVRTLTSLFSTTGAPGVGRQARAMLVSMAKPASRTASVSAHRHVAALRRWGSPEFGFDPAVETQWAVNVWERGGGRAASAGAARQIAAIQKSGDRTAQVRTITAPTLVIHGDRDPMIHPSGGRATADAIPGARLVTITNLRHNIVAGVVPQLVDLVDEHARAVDRRD